ncbi:DUF3137 domain-containing protein [Pelagicoccus mobilis]|uniref:DUF3137 domain-containing protein n=1 Tax=Pelagicoccus mobilis TaxID=415221 RepID=A0A934S0A5_9BACT|nr:DUF3137 domain-containing protein [Pelagicoccus mobilis]MBK1878820.1 DUF3137 domain-containing protein [Pelagicoccus mobilis]
MSYADTKESFEAQIQPVLERFEERRRQVLKKAAIGAGAVVGIAALAAVMLAANGQGDALAFVAIAGVVIAGIVFASITGPFKRAFKQEVVGAVVSAYDDSFVYGAGSGVRKSTFKASELFQKGIDRYRVEDHVRGKLDKTEFEFSELHAEYKTTSGSGKNRKTSWHTIFKGVFFVADFNKDFSSRTIVLPDTAEKMFGFLGRKLQDWNFARPDVIRLEDPVFEREFCVYGDDQVEARYILSPALMERIVRLKRKFGDQIYISFLYSKIYIAISSTKNRFEPKMFGPVDMALVREFKEDLDLVLGVIEDLNLNNRVWTKE